MRIAPLLLAMVAISAATTVTATLLLRPASPAAASDPSGAGLAQVQADLAALQRENQGLKIEIAQLRTVPAARESAITREPALDDLVARAVERWMQENRASGAATAGAAEAGATVTADFSLEAALGQLLDPFLDGEDRAALWKQALDGGKMQELIAALEVSAAADPQNKALQFELGYAYLQPIISGQAAGPQSASWAIKADAAFDKTLALDDQHWNARFNKAVSYTFWPPIMGKQKAAITNFETLVKQQSGMPPRPEFANTYLFLGTLYEQTGQADKAREIWNQGFSLFPTDSGLRDRLNPR